MGFSAKQVKALRRNLDHRYVRTREANGRELSYIEGWYAISEANRIFGFDGWSRETVDARCVLARENRGSFLAVYTARVRISVRAGGSTIIREGQGSGEGRAASRGPRYRPQGCGKPMPLSAHWPPSANLSGSHFMGLANRHQSSRGCRSNPVWQRPYSALDFIPMIQRRFHGRRVRRGGLTRANSPLPSPNDCVTRHI
jgi:Rad52/22 family double-strand break repair protein